MRLMPSFHLSYADVSAARVALAAGAVAGLIVIAACTDGPSRALTSPTAKSARGAVIGSGGFGQARFLQLCVDASAPAGTYHFKNIALNRSFAQDSWNNALSGNGFWDGAFWNDPGDGGNGTTLENAGVNVDYTLSPGGCVNVLTRTVGDAAFMATLPIADGGTCDPNTQTCGGKNDSFAAANIQFVSASNGYVYDHTDCLVDEGDLMPEHINPTTGNPPVPVVAWPGGGFNSLDPAFATYGCGTSNNPTRGFVNFEHGTTLTFFVTAPTTSNGLIAPTATTCEEYAQSTASTLSDLLAGYKQGAINNVSPGVFFYYATLTKPASTAAGFRTASIFPNPGNLVNYTVNQTQAYLYTYNSSTHRCTTATTLTLDGDRAGGSGGASLPAGTYILGVKFGTDDQKGISESASLQISNTLLATHNYIATVGVVDQANTAASVNTRSK